MAVIETNLDRPQTRSGAVGRSPGAGRRIGVRAIDAVAMLSGIIVSSAVRSPGSNGSIAVIVLLLAYGFWLSRGRLYQTRFITRRADEIRRIANAGFRSTATLGLAAFAFGLSFDRGWLVLSGFTTVLLLSVERELMRRRFQARRVSGQLTRRVLMIGDNAESERFTTMLRDEPELGYSVVSVVDPAVAADPRELTTSVLAAARAHHAHGVVIAATAIDTGSSNRLIRDLVEAGIHVELSSTLADIASDRLTVRPLGRFPVVYIEPRSRHGWRASAKRAFDLIVAGTGVMVLSPLFGVIYALIKLTSPGPAFFKQERVGKDGEPFQVLKFRTMVVEAEAMLAELSAEDEGSGPLFKMKEDPRVTKIGNLLRKTSLDELPQLWNVVRNEMSLVGPRPALQSEMKDWSEELYARLRVKPGITGMWQVSGRSSTTFEEYTRLDLYYVDNWSLVFDLAIMVRTLPAVIRSRGAY